MDDDGFGSIYDFLIFNSRHRSPSDLLLMGTKLGGVNGCKFIIYKLLTFRLCLLYSNLICFDLI
jgi:hypothetical protein